MDLQQRIANRGTVTARLTSLTDRDIRALLDGVPSRMGIGGATQTVAIAGRPVFVKTIRLSDREVDAGPGDTRNLFNLPHWYHYGVGEGSTGFNAWREVAAHEMADDWVTHGHNPGFPMLYHWRIVKDPAPYEIAEQDITRAVTFWQDSPQIEHRLRALAASATLIALFIEHVPITLSSWLPRQLTTNTQLIDAVVTKAAEQLFAAATHLRSRGVVHFDTHLDNVMTTGEDVILSDFGLLAADVFQLDSDERNMLTTNTDHDVAYCAAALTNAILGEVIEFTDARARNDWVRACARTGDTPGIPGSLVSMIRRLAPTAAVANDFYWQLHEGNVGTPFPSEALAATINDMQFG
ncbi:hypothetical protein BEL07_25570 [Mycolicibacterium grossiae]|uniref:Protein kinase domain-containing protein n=1 Tax=Mycolicibacterium grossiae TaxID=1552759 RepID=A0A1E8PX60_9MYCO|nr:hypothetical protein [Mycolicibacterium grossiae]OFJ50903.1 hypothetical protein BEL07_25570 [Mycolicibacterium grossiae]